MQGSLRIMLFGIGMLSGGFIIGYVVIGHDIPAEQLATIAVIIAIVTWFGSGADYLGFLSDWAKEKRDKRDKLESEIEDHVTINEGGWQKYTRRYRLGISNICRASSSQSASAFVYCAARPL